MLQVPLGLSGNLKISTWIRKNVYCRKSLAVYYYYGYYYYWILELFNIFQIDDSETDMILSGFHISESALSSKKTYETTWTSGYWPLGDKYN